MVSRGVVALVVVALAQAVCGSYCGCGGPVYPAPAPCVFPTPAPAPCVLPAPAPAFEEGCCPGPVVEKKTIVNKQVTVPYSYTEPTFSKQCYQRPAGVDRKVIPSAFESTPVCETQETVVQVPTTDIEVKEQPLCRKTCTTSEYVIQIPIVETTCTSAPLCKKTVRTQDNVLTTVSKKTSCAKQVCTQNKVVEQPFTQTVCQNYQGCVTKTGAQTVLKPEVVKSCVQLPPRKCLKPATGPGTYVDYGNGPVPVEGSYAAPSYVAEAFPAPGYVAEAFPAPGYVTEGFVPGLSGYGAYYGDSVVGAAPFVGATTFVDGYSGYSGYTGAPLVEAYGPSYFESYPSYVGAPVVEYGSASYFPGSYPGAYVAEAGVFPTSYLGGPTTCACV